jgi:choline dehydrogenase-like flavoprotein
MEYSRRLIEQIMRTAGAQDTLTIRRYAHLIGGCRMGTRPEESVIDSHHRVWGVPNLLVADGSACPTEGSANPALTIMALSSRLADLLTGRTVR